MPLIKGTASVEDSRSLSKALKRTRFPQHFSSQIQDWSKIQRPVIVQWIDQTITKSLGFEDEIVSSTAVNLFLPPEINSNSSAATEIDPRKAQIDLAGFLGEEEASKFASELWEMLLDASQQPTGIPRKILEEKKKELAAKQELLQQQQIQQQHIQARSRDTGEEDNNRATAVHRSENQRDRESRHRHIADENQRPSRERHDDDRRERRLNTDERPPYSRERNLAGWEFEFDSYGRRRPVQRDPNGIPQYVHHHRNDYYPPPERRHHHPDSRHYYPPPPPYYRDDDRNRRADDTRRPSRSLGPENGRDRARSRDRSRSRSNDRRRRRRHQRSCSSSSSSSSSSSRSR